MAATAVPVTVQSVTPNTAPANTTVVLTVTGSGFQNGAVVAFEGGLGLPQEVVAVQVLNPTTLAVTVNARNDGSQGNQIWDIRVTNPDTSTAVLLDAFTVTP
jgi:IPT/TIG domain